MTARAQRQGIYGLGLPGLRILQGARQSVRVTGGEVKTIERPQVVGDPAERLVAKKMQQIGKLGDVVKIGRTEVRAIPRAPCPTWSTGPSS